MWIKRKMILNNLNFTKSSASPQRLKKMKVWLAVEIAYLQHHVCKMNDRIVCQLFSLHDLSVSLRKQYYTPGKYCSVDVV